MGWPHTKRTLRRRLEETILPALAGRYPDAGCALEVQSPLEVLVATILSAQSTDRKVNEVTPGLFRRFPDVDAFADAEPADLEPLVQPIGLHRNKARNIVRAARALRDDFGGAVPRTIDALVTLPGVGRKTANCVLVNAHGLPGIMVDTHCIRVSRRLGLTDATDPDRIERDLKGIVPEDCWSRFSHRVIHHGRDLCTARRPDCDACPCRPACDAGRGRIPL
jgi:endonuclease-3